jgi:thioredoxin reductase (NADPH)
LLYITLKEFDRLLEKHATETGLPVIVDYYSDHCGPCRMMAPIFKKVAEDYIDRAVFVKVDTNTQNELGSRYQIRSLPTFQYFVNGQKFDEAVGGIGEGPLRQQTDKAIRDAELTNVNLTIESLIEYYKTYDATKSEADVTKVYTKCVDLVGKKFNPTKQCIGDSANKLARQLKKKYGKGPVLVPRFTEESRKSTNANADKKDDKDNSNSRSSTPNARRASSSSSGSSSKPNLHLASIDELKAEIEKRLDEEREKEVENEVDDDENELDPDFAKTKWIKSNFPERMIIIGAGPAGLSAAIYGARAGLVPLVIAPSMGGQLQGKGVDVENYPGLNTTGPSVVALMKRQAAHFGTVFEDDIVTNIIVPTDRSGSKKPIQVVTNSSGIIDTHTVIVATGAESNWLGIAGEWELRGGGVSSCATCDGFLYSDKHVIVVGGGDTAMEDALVLARTSKKVTIIHRRDTFRASKVLANRVLNYHDPNKINIVWNSVVTEIVGKNEQQQQQSDDEVVDMDKAAPSKKVVSGVQIKDVVTGEITKIPCDAVFVAIGHTPNTQFVNGIVEFNTNHPGYIVTKIGSTQTSVPGIYAAGDVADATYRQAITSAGSGAQAALDAERYLSENGLGNEAAEFEAELLAEFLDTESQNQQQKTSTNNIYDDVGTSIKGMKESLASAGEL